MIERMILGPALIVLTWGGIWCVREIRELVRQWGEQKAWKQMSNPRSRKSK